MGSLNNIGIYKITNKVNGKIYVGSSTNLNRRYYLHLNLLRNNKHFNIHLQSSYNKYNEENFEFSIIEYCTADQLKEKEEYYIKILDCLNEGYNINQFSDRPPSWKGKKHTKETIEKISQGNIGKKLSEKQINGLKERSKGELNPMYGKKYYDIWVEKYGKEEADRKMIIRGNNISKKGKGRIVSEETKNKISNAHKNKIVSDEVKEKLRIINIGKIISNETKLKMSKKRKGELNPACKIKDKDVKIILQELKQGISVKNLSIKYKVSTVTIRNIKSGKRKI
jgi:group I intron endonuclease